VSPRAAARLPQGLAASAETADVDRLTMERDRLLTAVVTGKLRDADHVRMAAEGLPSV
jgi:hypothetical protein